MAGGRINYPPGGSGGSGVDSLSVTGEPQLTGNVTLSEGSNITLTQVGNDIEIAATGGGGGGVDSVSGTTNRITVDNTDPANPIVDIASTYVGQNTITTLGTIATGTWNGSLVVGQYGGTGVANTGKTITVSGNTVVGSSTHTVTLATSANTSVTLPTSGTLATLAGSETLTNKTINGNDNTLTVLAGTQLSGQVPLANGGTGANLSDPGADRILFWDDSNSTVDWLTVGSGLSITGTTIATTGGSGDVVGPSSATDNAVALFDSTTGKLIKNSSLLYSSNTVTTSSGSLTINSGGAGNVVNVGGAISTLNSTANITFENTGVHILDTNASHDLILAPGSNLTADRTLTLTTGDVNRTIDIAGNLTLAAAFTTSGANALTLTTTGSTNVTLPTTGTLATLAGSETLTNKTLTSPIISSISNTGTLTLPTSTDTLVGRATTDTLTNKTIDAASNTITNLPTTAYADASVTSAKMNFGSASAFESASGTTTSSTFTATLSGSPGTNPEAIVTVPSSGLAYVTISCNASNNFAVTARGVGLGFAVSGATTLAADVNRAARPILPTSGTSNSFAFSVLLGGLTPGSNTFTLQYNTTGDTATFSNRRISVIPIGD